MKVNHKSTGGDVDWVVEVVVVVVVLVDDVVSVLSRLSLGFAKTKEGRVHPKIIIQSKNGNNFFIKTFRPFLWNALICVAL